MFGYQNLNCNNEKKGSSAVNNESLKDPSSSSINLPGTQKKSKKNSSQPKTRTVFTCRQKNILESEFNLDNYLTKSYPRRQQLCNQLNLSEKTIQVWFKNRRVKDKSQPTNSHFKDVSGLLPLPSPSSTPSSSPYQRSMISSDKTFNNHRYSPYRPITSPPDFGNNPLHYSHHQPSSSSSMNLPPLQWPGVNSPTSSISSSHSNTFSQYQSELSSNSDYYSHVNNSYYQQNIDTTIMPSVATLVAPLQASSNGPNSVNLRSTHNVAASNVNNNQQFISTDVSPLPNTSTTYSSTTTHHSNTFSPYQSELSSNSDYYSPVNNFYYPQNIDRTIMPSVATPVVPSQATPTSSIPLTTAPHSNTFNPHQFELSGNSDYYSPVNNSYHSQNYTQNIDTTIMPSVATPVVPSQATPTSSIPFPTTFCSNTFNPHQFELSGHSDYYSHVNNSYHSQNYTQNIDTTIMPSVATPVVPSQAIPTSSIPLTTTSRSNTFSQYRSELSSNSDYYSHGNNSYYLQNYTQNINRTIMSSIATSVVPSQEPLNGQNSLNLRSTHNVAASNVNNNQQFIPTDVSPSPNTPTTYSFQLHT